MDTPEKLLEIRGLGKSYASRGHGSSGQKALEGIDFELEPGELVSVIGPSGAGKSTFLRCINRLIEPTEGAITFCGKPVTHLARGDLRPLRRQIAMIFQNYNLVYRLTAIQNVLHGRLGYKGALAGSFGIYSEAEKVRAFEILDEVGLGSFAYRRADQLSGGQKQRVGIARALIQDPKIILCDEPIASLDPKSSRMVMEQLRSLTRTRGIACIVNLHQVDAALEYSDRIVGLHDGHKVFEGMPEDVTREVIAMIYEGSEDVLGDVAIGMQPSGQPSGLPAHETVPVGSASSTGSAQ
jgi:phosphonate transport system ATP-binding protein